jgi:IclR family KDG regulon transcriptional repressor
MLQQNKSAKPVTRTSGGGTKTAKANGSAKTSEPKTRLSSVGNAIRLIKAFSDDAYEIGISELSKRLVLPKSTVHRLASTLADAGMLEQNQETGRYRLGLVMFELGSLVRRKMDFSSTAKPYLMDLRESTGETVHLTVLGQTSVVYINTLESKQSIRMTLDVGLRKPAYCTAEGKALLAFKPPEVVEQIAAAGMPARTPKTITDLAAFQKELAAVRARGYAFGDEEYEEGLRCIAAPVRDHYGNVIATVSIAGPSQRLTKKVMESYAAVVMDTAENISLRLGYQPFRNTRSRSTI